MVSSRIIKSALVAVALVALGLFAISCGGSKANVRTESAPSNSPPLIDVTTAAAISRDLPRFFEATGSLAGDQQTDVAASIAGKVVAIGVEMGSYVKVGRYIISLL